MRALPQQERWQRLSPRAPQSVEDDQVIHRRGDDGGHAQGWQSRLPRAIQSGDQPDLSGVRSHHTTELFLIAMRMTCLRIQLGGGSLFDDHFASAGSRFMHKVGPFSMSKNNMVLIRIQECLEQEGIFQSKVSFDQVHKLLLFW